MSHLWTRKWRNTGSHGTVDMPESKDSAVIAPKMPKLQRWEEGIWRAVDMVWVVANVE
jgi:hypothetical protein